MLTNTSLPGAVGLWGKGKWQIGTYDGRDGKRQVYICDGLHTDYPSSIGYGIFSFDYPERVPKFILLKLKQLFSK